MHLLRGIVRGLVTFDLPRIKLVPGGRQPFSDINSLFPAPPAPNEIRAPSWRAHVRLWSGAISRKRKRRSTPPVAKLPISDRIYPVYQKGSVIGQRPIMIVDYATRQEYLDNGSAKSVSNGAAIQLLVNLEQLRGTSCQMGPRVIEGAAMGEHFYRTIADHYPSFHLGTYCPLIPRPDFAVVAPAAVTP